jgi:Transposase and inactivated derivatives
MEELLERCAGLDVHKKTVVACIMIGLGKKMKKEIRTFGTMTEDLRELGSWLQGNKIQDVAIESTGIYWEPVFNILEVELGICVTLANARHIKNVPGKKTDIKDSEWICKLLKNGLLTKSFIPPEKVRHLRNLTRSRKSLVKEVNSVKNRIIKNLEQHNIKLASVFSDVHGASGRRIIKAIAGGQVNPEKLISLVDKQVKTSLVDIKKALTGTIQQHHFQSLRRMIDHMEYLEKLISDNENEITAFVIKNFTQEQELLKQIPGISDTISATMIAEMGTDMNQFHSHKHFASWVGLAPGNNESAGIKKSSAISKGNNHFKTALVQGAWAAIRSKATFFSAAFQRLKPRLGAKKALVAIARKMAVCAYWILNKGTPYRELGANYIDKRALERKALYHKKNF